MNETTIPQISVYIATSNRVHLLKRSVRSVLDQNHPSFELIVVDDASSDGTKDFLEEISSKNPKIRFFTHNERQGAPVARNLAIKNAKGKFVTGLDDDDIMLDDCLNKLEKAYSEQYSFVCGNYFVVQDKSGRVPKKKQGVLTLKMMLYENFVGNQIFTTKEKFLGVDGFDPKLKASQDYDTWLRLLIKYGDALKILDPIYEVFKDHGLETISNSDNKLIGMNQFLGKHRHIMKRSQIKAQKFRMHILGNKPITFFQMLSFLSPHLYKAPLSNWASQFRIIRAAKNMIINLLKKTKWR